MIPMYCHCLEFLSILPNIAPKSETLFLKQVQSNMVCSENDQKVKKIEKSQSNENQTYLVTFNDTFGQNPLENLVFLYFLSLCLYFSFIFANFRFAAKIERIGKITLETEDRKFKISVECCRKT